MKYDVSVQGFGGVSRTFPVSHTNKFCGICVEDTEPAAASAGSEVGRWACEGPGERVPRRPWKGPTAADRVGKSEIAVKRRGEALKVIV